MIRPLPSRFFTVGGLHYEVVATCSTGEQTAQDTFMPMQGERIPYQLDREKLLDKVNEKGEWL